MAAAEVAGVKSNVNGLPAENGPKSPAGTTTTISTIAVRAEPHSTVVVALLKSIGYVDLRIDKMHPALLEIGSNPEENAQLLLIHADLFQRLMGKQQQVEELLGRAEQLVNEQTEPGDVLVYEAMAEGLAAAWKGLSRQLEMRGFILEDTQKLYDLSQKHEELSKLLNSRLQKEDSEKREDEETRKILSELAELTSDGMEIGSNVIGQIRVLASLADNAERAREAFEACCLVESLMLKMAQSWELLDGAWRELKMAGMPEQAENLQKRVEEPVRDFGPQLDSAEQRLRTTQQRFEQLRVSQAENGHLEEMRSLVERTKMNRRNLQTLAEQIYAQCTKLPAEMSTRCADLLERYNRLLKELETREDLLGASLEWLREADALLVQLDKIRVELGVADEKMAGELGPLAQQKGVALIEQGEHLMAQLKAEDGAGIAVLRKQIAEKVHLLKGSVIDLVQLARQRIASGKAQKLAEKIESLERWLRAVAEPFLAESTRLNPNAAETSEFIARHQRFSTDLTDKEHQLQSVLGLQELLGQAEVQRLEGLQKRIALVREVLERRLQLGKKMEQLQKLSRELETSFHFLSTLLEQQSGRQQKDTEKQMRHLLHSLNEQCIQERHQSDTFRVLASGAKEKDPRLGLDQALDWTRNNVESHQKQFDTLNAKCQQWEQTGPSAKGKVPTFVMTLPEEKLIWESQNMELYAKIEGEPEPQIQWLKDGREVQERTGQCRMGWLNEMATLTIEEILPEDAGEYTLKAENRMGKIEGKTKLVVKPMEQSKYHQQQQKIFTKETTTIITQQEDQQIVKELGEFKPRFVRQLQNVSVREGDQFTLDCIVVGNPEPKIIWYREEAVVRESERIRLSFKGDHCRLSCANASGEDAGLYKVLAVNLHGETMNFCRVCIVPPSPKRKIAPATMAKPNTLQSHHIVSTEQTAEAAAELPPSIEPQLCSQVVREGQTVTFTTQIRGSPAPDVQWLFNGQPIPVGRPDFGLSRDLEGRCTLTIACVLLDHAGQYTVEARNQFGHVTSSATLNVLASWPDGPAGMEMPVDGGLRQQQDGKTNQNWTSEQQQFFTSTFSQQQQQHQISDQYYRQQIYHNGTRWSTESPQQQGPIYAVSKSEKAESRRTSSELGDPGYSSLANAPECLRPFPAEVTIDEGEKAEVDCLMLGNPRPKVQWFFNGRPTKSNADLVEFSNVGDTYAIRFNTARLECAGWYRLVAENIRGRCESLTLVHVRPRSMIPKLTPAGGYHQQRARRSIGGVQGLLQWQKRQLLLQQHQNRALSTPPRPYYAGSADQSPAHTPTQMESATAGQRQMPALMSVSTYQPSEGPPPGLLSFASSQPLVEAHSEHRIMATGELLDHQQGQIPPKGSPPHFMQTLISSVVSEGQSAQFEAIVTGLPQPNIHWTKDGQPLSLSENVRIRSEGGRVMLSVNLISQQDAGKYCCVAENPSGMASSSAQLVLRPKTLAPDFVERLVSQEVEEGATLQWTVKASGEPEPGVIWLRDGQPIVEVQGVRLIKELPFVYGLLIDKVQMSDAGQFTCILENTAGEARSTADLVVRPPGAPPGKYVHVTKVTQEKQIRGEELARNETVTIEGVQRGEEEEEEDEEEEE